MHLLIFGATGATGGPLTRLALEAGHTVTAVVRQPSRLAISHASLHVVQGDVLLPGSFADALRGVDAVMSCLGVNTTKPTTFYSTSMRNIVDAMHAAGVSRVMAMSASGLDIGPDINVVQKFFTRYVLQRILRHPYADLRRMEALMKESDLGWTIVRPPMLTNGEPRGRWRVAVDAFLAHPFKISRKDLAAYMLSDVSNAAVYRRTVEVGY